MAMELYVDITVSTVNLTEDDASATGVLYIRKMDQTVQWRANLKNGFVKFEEDMGLKSNMVLQLKKMVLGVIGRVNLPLSKVVTIKEE